MPRGVSSPRRNGFSGITGGRDRYSWSMTIAHKITDRTPARIGVHTLNRRLPDRLRSRASSSTPGAVRVAMLPGTCTGSATGNTRNVVGCRARSVRRCSPVVGGHVSGGLDGRLPAVVIAILSLGELDELHHHSVNLFELDRVVSIHLRTERELGILHGRRPLELE